MVAVAIGGSAALGLVGSAISGSGAQAAAKEQANAATQAAQMQQQQYQQTRADLLPYNTAGQTDLPQLANQWQTSQAGLQSAWNNAQAAIPGQITQQSLLNTPSYQWNLDQGLKATQNQRTSPGLGISGTAIKAGENFGTGLAQNTWQQVFGNQQTQYGDQAQQFANANTGYNTVFNQLYSPASLGENAGAQLGSTGANLSIAAGNQTAAAGQALAAGTGTAAGAYNQGLQGVGNAGVTAALLASNNALGGGGAYTGPSANALNQTSEDPASLQSSLGLGANQFVP